MKQRGVGISYYHTQADNFYSSETNEDERAYTRLTMELLIENEDRYKARAKYMLKNYLLRINFGDQQVEYYIYEKLASFSVWEIQTNCFQNLIVVTLGRRQRDKIATLVNLFAMSEAKLTLNQ